MQKNISTCKKESFLLSFKKDYKVNKSLYIMLLPVLLYYIIFAYFPMYGVIIAFQDYNPASGVLGSDWVGIEHFKDFFTNVYSWRLIRNTLRISFANIFFGFPAPIILALLINETRNKYFKKTVQTLTYLPHFISLVVICGMIKVFTTPGGVVYDIVNYLTGEERSLLARPEYFVPVYVITDIWQEIGWGSIIYMSALSGIDSQLYEACQIDGGNRLRQLWHITLPGLLPTIVIMLILRMGSVLNVGYEKIILLYNELTRETADVISTYTYRKGLQEFDWSYGSSVGIFNSVINLIFLLATNYISRRYTETSLW